MKSFRHLGNKTFFVCLSRVNILLKLAHREVQMLHGDSEASMAFANGTPPSPPVQPPWHPMLCGPPQQHGEVTHQVWEVYLGVGLAALGSFICSVALLIGKRSADVEAGLPLCKRWRWWSFFIINTTAEVSLSSVALSLAPLAQVAPCAGLAVIFSALLARAGCVPGVNERLSILEWLSLVVAVVALVASSFFGPKGASRILPYEDYGQAFASPAFLSYALVATTMVITWLLVILTPALRHLRPSQSSIIYPLLSAYGAGTCGSFSIVWQNIFVHSIEELFGQCGLHVLQYWVTYASIVGLVLCAPTQLFLLNTALATGKASYTVPVYTCNNIANGVIVSGLLFHDFDAMPARKLAGFFTAFGIVLVAVAVLSSLQGRRATDALVHRNKLAAIDAQDGKSSDLSYRLDYFSLRVGGVSPLALVPAASWNDELLYRRRFLSVSAPRATEPLDVSVPVRSSSMSNLPSLLEQLYQRSTETDSQPPTPARRSEIDDDGAGTTTRRAATIC